MTQRDLYRAVARATGESIDRIDRMGFHEVVLFRPDYSRMSRAIRARRLRLNHQHPSPTSEAPMMAS